jgi:hypothetical protein
LQHLKEKFPFLTYGKYLEQEYLGIIQNADNHLISMYVYSNIFDEPLRKKFLECGEIWWWESNRQLPINIFLKKKFEVFRPYLKTFIRKDFEIVFGPVVSLQEVITKRIKRRTIQLVKKI